ARHNMVEQQIRPWNVPDQRVLETISQIPREAFVPREFLNLAYAEINIDLGHGQVMMTPAVEARLLQAAGVHADDKILEIGTGSGYFTALLATMGGHVYSVEIIPELQQRAREHLAGQGIDNVTLEEGDGACGWSRYAPYDLIVITGSLPLLPESFQQSLAPGGRLIAIVGESPVMEAHLITAEGQDNYRERYLFNTEIPPLINAPRPERFQL
ncbi:MAG TPA: protein-L-isoaspartate O-methyltransferase, partial [Gammaproteobacteria bacterium]|nr:protein-L-isoaspartate O-methyltransferase [Gammaproteobacteria bacterium]